jgi:branched-chain amino acid transport system ATP-binding protein
MSSLTIQDLKVHFGGVRALDGVSVNILEHGVHAFIGPNGAGKTSLINAITGVYRPTAGKVLLDERDITGAAPHRLARLGITRTFQNLQIFWTMTVLENVLSGFYLKNHHGFFRGLLRMPSLVRREADLEAKALALLDSVGLLKRANEQAGNLPYGELKRLEIARALASEPRLLFLDEPVAGCTQSEKRSLGEVMRRVADQMNITIVLVEHDMKLVMSISDRVTVMVRGQVLADDHPSQIKNDPKVIEAYLGVSLPRKDRKYAAAS